MREVSEGNRERYWIGEREETGRSRVISEEREVKVKASKL